MNKKLLSEDGELETSDYVALFKVLIWTNYRIQPSGVLIAGGSEVKEIFPRSEAVPPLASICVRRGRHSG